MNPPTPSLVLRDLPVALRIVLASFLVSVGVGYFSALVQLHFQNASPGKLLPEADDAIAVYHGRPELSQFERLLVTDESKPFNGSGTMRPAFTTRSGGWKRAVERMAKEKGFLQKDGKPDLMRSEQELRAERNGEILALLDWIRSGASETAYKEDNHPLPEKLANHPFTAKYLVTDAKDEIVVPHRARIRSILSDRCERCHSESAGGAPAQYPLDTYEQVVSYCEVETNGGGMSLKKLAQSTHVHLLGFSMLYGLTGLVFALTSYPCWVRVVLAPFPLLVQLVDIACWWLSRADPIFARAIVVTGGMVGAGLFLQIVLSLFNMFGKTGKVVLLLLLIALSVGGYVVTGRYIMPYLVREGLSAMAPE